MHPPLKAAGKNNQIRCRWYEFFIRLERKIKYYHLSLDIQVLLLLPPIAVTYQHSMENQIPSLFTWEERYKKNPSGVWLLMTTTPRQSHRKINAHPSFRGKISSTNQPPFLFTFNPTTERELKTRGLKKMPWTTS